MTDDTAKKAILARRARFIAAAVMSAGLASCEERRSAEPTVCLSIAFQPPPDAAPTVCLSVMPMPQLPPDGTGATADGGSEAGPADAGAVDAGAVDAGATRPLQVPPHVCLSISPKRPPPPPKPTICLSYLP